MTTNHSLAQALSTSNLVNYFLRNMFMYNIRMLFCHVKVALFAHEKIKYMGIYFPRNFITNAKHIPVVMVEAIKCLGKYMTICLILACEKEAICM